MNEQTEQKPAPKPFKSWKQMSWIFGISLLAILAIAIVVILLQSSTINMKKDLVTQVQQTVEQLQGDLSTQTEENTRLTTSVEEGLAEIESLQQNISNLQARLRESKVENKRIQERLRQIEDLKQLLEEDLANLKEENADLFSTSKTLRDALESSEEEVQELTEEVVELTDEVVELSDANEATLRRLYKLAPAGYTIDRLEVIARNKRDKLVSKARRTDEIRVTFDLNNVPRESFGKHDIHLLLTNFDGTPVQSLDLYPVRIQPAGSGDAFSMQVNATGTFQLGERQSATLAINTEDKLDPGVYHLLVYADNGYLGSSGLTLR